MDADIPIFQQIAQIIEAQILDGSLPESAQVPSTNELALFHRINPATAAKGINLLVDQGILYKQRGVGMFVSPGARNKLLQSRKEHFTTKYVRPLVSEAQTLELSYQEVASLIKQEMSSSPNPNFDATVEGSNTRSASVTFSVTNSQVQ